MEDDLREVALVEVDARVEVDVTEAADDNRRESVVSGAFSGPTLTLVTTMVVLGAALRFNERRGHEEQAGWASRG